MTKVKWDQKGLFVVAGGYVGRPRGKLSLFRSGDPVRAHHFRGSEVIGVGMEGCSFKKRTGYEIWWIDCPSPQVQKVMKKAGE